MSGGYLEYLKEAHPDVDWDAEMAKARERRDRERRLLRNRFRHWLHKAMHPELHRERCSCSRPGGER